MLRTHWHQVPRGTDRPQLRPSVRVTLDAGHGKGRSLRPGSRDRPTYWPRGKHASLRDTYCSRPGIPRVYQQIPSYGAVTSRLPSVLTTLTTNNPESLTSLLPTRANPHRLRCRCSVPGARLVDKLPEPQFNVEQPP